MLSYDAVAKHETHERVLCTDTLLGYWCLVGACLHHLACTLFVLMPSVACTKWGRLKGTNTGFGCCSIADLGP